MASEKDNSRSVLFSDRDNPAAILPVLSAALWRFGGGWRGGVGSAVLHHSRRH